MAVRSVTHPLAVLLACVLLGTCTPSALAEAQEEVDGACVKATTCPAPSASELSQDRTFFDDASSVQHVFSQSNVMVATDNPDGFFWKDGGRFIQSDRSIPASITYRFNEGGMDRVRVSVAILSESIEVRNQVNITIRPYVDESCSPPPTPTTLSDKNFDTMKNGMEHVEIEYDVGLLPQLNCELAKFVQIKFWAPEGSEAQIMSVKLIGDGEINGLQELANPNDNPQQQSGLFDNDLVIYILIGVGAVFLLVMLALVWVCCGRPCCCGSKDAGEHNIGVSTDAGVQLPRQVVIPVDCVVPDMPVSIDEDSGHLGAMNQKYASGAASITPSTNSNQIQYMSHQSHVNTLGMQSGTANSGVARTHSNATNGSHAAHAHTAAEPVVDLSLPTPYAQPDYMGTGFAPRQGQDIFDTWQEGGMSAYQSGEEYDASGPLDTRERSFTGNPPVSSTGNTSPTQESSVIGVTAQLGMRLKELKSLQGEHERVAKGQADSNGEFITTPEPLGVKYGRKIGVGGFGAVYVGEWAGKTVAVKVIKMPHSQKQSEDKEKMAFMEYAISGILLHNNIVQTHQADIRPVFLDDDTETATVSKSGWTGLGEFLSNEAISQRMHKSMRIQEWELRLIMEFCNKGNLKEAIRQKSLMQDGSVKALEVALLALDIAKACQAIHKHNIIHGDLKPHNVLLTVEPEDERGWIGKIADFGLSVKIKRGEQHVSGIQHGTEGYVAPEVLQTRRMVKASDVYSFGIIMWELWHARLYYEEYRHAQRRMRRVTLDFRPTFERGCPEEWINLAKSCWALRPEERPDFDRVVKMMRMIIATIRDKINTEGVITETH